MAMAARHLVTCLATVTASVLLSFSFPPLAAGDPLGQFCDTSGNYTANDPYQANIQSLAATLPKNTSASRTLFATATLGSVPNIVYALALCRGDTNASVCESCVASAFVDAQQLCPYNKGVTIFYDSRFLRYSHKNFLANPADAGDSRFLANPADRPMMSIVNLMLSSSNMPHQAPARPAFCFQRNMCSRGQGNSQSTSTSLVSENEVSITELEAR